MDFYEKRILLGRKPNEKLFRLPGGFAEIGSDSYEEDAIREVKEETNLEVLGLCYVGSTLVDDWRYRNQRDKIKTLLFAVPNWRGVLKAGDDLEEIQWFPWNVLEDKDITNVVPNHIKLLGMLFAWKNERRA